MKKLPRYKFYFKKSSDLTSDEKKQMMHLMVATYPAFKELYLKHKYYSTVRPQKENLIKEGDKIVGVGKFLWKNLKIGKKPLKFFACGVLIEKRHQGIGLGTEIIKKNIKEARKMGADILYGSTANPVMDKILKQLKFKKIDARIFYKDAKTKKIKKETDNVYIFEFKWGIIKKLESLPKFYIGTGPI